MNYADISKGMSTASGAAPVVLGDLYDIYKSYNPTFIGNPQQNFNSVRNVNQLQNMRPDYMNNSMESIGAGKMFLNSQKNALEGASAFSSLGPWGMLGGATGGMITSLVSDIGHNTVGMSKNQQQVDMFNQRLTNQYNNAFTSSVDLMNEDARRNRNISYFADGGQMSGIEDQLFNEFNNGGSHESNPNGGIPQGFGMNGVPNIVEEGEVKFKDYIFSNRISLDNKTAKQLQLPEKFVKKSYADIAKNLQREHKERQNDPISKAGVEAMLGRLQQAQETFKDARRPKTSQNTFAEGGRLDGLADPPIVFDPNALRNSDPKLQPQYTTIDNTNTVQRQAPKTTPQKSTPIKFIEPTPVAIPTSQPTPVDATYTTQSTPMSNQEVAVTTAQDFLTDFMAKPIQDELYEQELAELNPQQRQLVESIGKDVIYQGRQDWSDKTFGTVSQGQDYNAVQDWWRDFSQTQKGQEITKFINNPIINTGAMMAAPGLAVGLMAADYADQYGQGTDAGEIGKEVLQDIGTMMVAGRLLGGNQLNMMPNNLGASAVKFKGKKFLNELASIPSKNGRGISAKNIDPKTGMLKESIMTDPLKRDLRSAFTKSTYESRANAGKTLVKGALVTAIPATGMTVYNDVQNYKAQEEQKVVDFKVNYLKSLLDKTIENMDAADQATDINQKDSLMKEAELSFKKLEKQQKLLPTVIDQFSEEDKQLLISSGLIPQK